MKKFHIVFKTENKDIDHDESQDIITTGKNFEGQTILKAITTYVITGNKVEDIVIVYQVSEDGRVQY